VRVFLPLSTPALAILVPPPPQPLPPSTQEPIEILEDEDEVLEGEELEEVVPELLRFSSSWRIVAGKDLREVLPASQHSAVFEEGALTIRRLEEWKAHVFERLQPRKFEVLYTEGVASYEKCPRRDECPHVLTTKTDLYGLQQLLKLWHTNHPRRGLRLDITVYTQEQKDDEVIAIAIAIATATTTTERPITTSQSQQSRGRRTATAAQRMALPGQLQSESAAGNYIPELTDRWPYINAFCLN